MKTTLMYAICTQIIKAMESLWNEITSLKLHCEQLQNLEQLWPL